MEEPDAGTVGGLRKAGGAAQRKETLAQLPDKSGLCIVSRQRAAQQEGGMSMYALAVVCLVYFFLSVFSLFLVHCVFLRRYIRTFGFGEEPTVGVGVFSLWIDRYRAYRIAKRRGHMPWSLIMSTWLEITMLASFFGCAALEMHLESHHGF